MTIKDLSLADCKSICQLCDDNFSDGWTEEMLVSGFNSGRLFAKGAFLEERIVGVILFSVGLDDADIEIVLTDATYRKKGVATALIESAENMIKEKGISKILLEVRKSNLSAISLYNKNKFKQISVRKKYYSDGEDALVMCKEI